MILPLQLPKIDEDQIAAADSLFKANLEAKARMFAGMTWEERFQTLLNDLWHFGLKILVVLAIFIVGRWLIRKILKALNRIFDKRKVDPSLRTFVRSLVSIVLYIFLFYLIIAYLGVNTSLFVALFAAAGLAIGMAMSGVFQNFAGGVMILLLKPFRVGDSIESQGQSGSVIDIRLFNTILRTSDNQTILLPNGSISTSIIKNTNQAKTRRLEWIISLEYGTDFEAVRKVLVKIMTSDERVMESPVPTVDMGNLAASSIDITVRCWVKSGDYWSVFYDLNARFYKTLPGQGFSFPYSQLDVNIRSIPPNGSPPAK